MKYNIINITVLLSLLAFSSCKEEKKAVENTVEVEEQGYRVTKKQFEASGFQIGKLQKYDFLVELSVPGVLSIPTKNTSDVSSLIGGKVDQYSFVEGQWVKRGQLLFNLSNPEIIDLQEQYLVGKNQVSYLTSEYQRLKQLMAQNLATQKEYAQVKAELEKERTLMRIRGKKLRLYGFSTDNMTSDNVKSSLPIYAPISGYIKHIHIQPGTYLNARETALSITSSASMRVILSVLERDAADIKRGQEIYFSLPNNPDNKFKGKVSLISNEIEDNNTIKVYCTITEKIPSMKEGMHVEGHIGLTKKRMDALPEDALVKDGNEYKVLIVTSSDEDYTFDDVTVNKIMTSDGKVAIEKQPNLEGKTILVKGAYDIY